MYYTKNQFNNFKRYSTVDLAFIFYISQGYLKDMVYFCTKQSE